MVNRLDEQYQALLQDILDNGVTKADRTGTGTKSIFGYTIRHNMKDGFPLLTTKKMPFKTIVTELLWFLKGDTNIKYLVDNNCHIWDGDCYQAYLKEYKKYKKQNNMNIPTAKPLTPVVHGIIPSGNVLMDYSKIYSQLIETKEKIKGSVTGLKHSEETGKKMSEDRKGRVSGKKGKINSEEHNRKASESLKKAWEIRKLKKLEE